MRTNPFNPAGADIHAPFDPLCEPIASRAYPPASALASGRPSADKAAALLGAFFAGANSLLSYPDRRRASHERLIAQGRLRVLCYAAVKHAVSVALDAATVGVLTHQRFEHHFANIRLADPFDCSAAPTHMAMVAAYGARETFEPDDEFAKLRDIARAAGEICDRLSRPIASPGDPVEEIDRTEAALRAQALQVFYETARLCLSDREQAKKLVRTADSTLTVMATLSTVSQASHAGASDAVGAVLGTESEGQS